MAVADYKPSIAALITVAVWFVGTATYGYFWVNHMFETETLYGYERSRLLISTAFIAYKLPYLLIALIVVLVLEFLLTLYSARKKTLNG